MFLWSLYFRRHITFIVILYSSSQTILKLSESVRVHLNCDVFEMDMQIITYNPGHI